MRNRIGDRGRGHLVRGLVCHDKELGPAPKTPKPESFFKQEDRLVL